MSSSRHRRFSAKQPVSVVDVGCSCRLSKLSSLFTSLRSKPRFPNPPDSLPFSSSSAAAADSLLASTSTTGMTQEENAPSPAPAPREKERRRRSRRTMTPATESVAVVKETSDPYADFRDSMVQMIVEEELYAWDDLNELLHRFLTLNSPRHHQLILHAFADLWSGVFSPPSPCR